MAPRRKTRRSRGRTCKRNCTRYIKRARTRRSTRFMKRSRKQRGGNSATLRDPAKYNDLVDVIRDPEERDGFSAPVLMSREAHDEMFDLTNAESDSGVIVTARNNGLNQMMV